MYYYIAGMGRTQDAAEPGSGRPSLGDKRRAGLGLDEAKPKRARAAEDAGTRAPQHGGEHGVPAERPVYSDQCTAFVKSIAAGTSDDELRAVFRSCGELRGLRHMRDGGGETRVRIPGTFLIVLLGSFPIHVLGVCAVVADADTRKFSTMCGTLETRARCAPRNWEVRTECLA